MSSDPGTPGKAAGSPIPAGRKRDSVGAPAHPIIKDIGEIHSRLLDHRPVIQGEIRYFIKEFEEKRGLREVRVLENLNTMIYETNDQTLPKCEQVMHGDLNEVLKRLQAANHRILRLQQREQEERKEDSNTVEWNLQNLCWPRSAKIHVDYMNLRRNEKTSSAI
ncbi:carboxyl-terminal PDZ ligand of neuronal nitric oxide synthase protein-like [Platysternon megacephalum]|uniref:Biogenesis of lysosome-related organelles complex 1 subunit 5 n=1 Tax=Platysternon megacephalum TaxID=55544 RepID=A0A4D9EGE5_9SAUR|nr:carboxyl-terminal PDZ ligand of neuronal nitric oxide synthase protein-like [Platysternon megacephalum]